MKLLTGKQSIVLQMCVLFSCTCWITSTNKSIIERLLTGQLNRLWAKFAELDNENLSPRIVGGQTAHSGEFPYMVSLKHMPSGLLLCGGSLISSQYVISAAHCVKGVYPGFIVATIGTERLSDRYSGYVRDIVQVWINGGFNFKSFDYDVAILKLKSPVPLGHNVVPICLVGDDRMRYNRNQVMAVGWGREREAVPLSSEVLRKVNVPIINSRTCARAYRRFRTITDRMLCAGFRRGGRDTCQGDSGGPLVVKSGNKMTQLGIVSWGNGCARPGYYGVYTKMSKVISWIKKYTTVQEC
ncbi:Transmembrane protease serine 9 [Chamberlinius hualienensis]